MSKIEILRAKCFILFPLLKMCNQVEIDEKVKEIDELLDSMLFTKMEKYGLKYALEQILI